ncbi:MAG TPA: hypothetical protein VIU29_06880 [Candidatus Deferrimicrobiaceae bacterium]
MRIEKAIAVSLAIHLLAAGACAVSLGIKRDVRSAEAAPVFAELVPPAPAPAPDTAHRSPDLLAEKAVAEAPPEKTIEAPSGTGIPMPQAPPAAALPAAVNVAAPPDPAPSRTEPSPPGTPATATASGEPAPDAMPDNVATADATPALDPGMLARVRMHHLAMESTEAFYRLVPGELGRIVTETLGGSAIMSQGDALVHMDVTPSGQVGKAHVQANSRALLNRLERVDWRDALPRRPLAACNAIHLRISVEGNDIRVRVELL